MNKVNINFEHLEWMVWLRTKIFITFQTYCSNQLLKIAAQIKNPTDEKSYFTVANQVVRIGFYDWGSD